MPFLYLLLFVFLTACAHSTSVTEKKGPDGKPLMSQGSDSDPLTSHLKEVESFRANEPELPRIVDEEFEIIPVEFNLRVEQWISYFQGRGRPHMERYLGRSTRYMKLMKRILRQNGLPEDLIYVALIESGFTSRATSSASAVGYWQFIKETGRRYGMEISALIDERRDPVLSTQAAAEYFKGLYSLFGSWYLAMASYNVGENRVKKEVVKQYTQDFWELARKNRLPKETINYVPKFIAAKMIASHPEKYGFSGIDYEDPLEFELVRLQKPVNLKVMAQKMGLDYDDFKQLNPKYRGEIAPLKQGIGILELRVPLGQVQIAMNAAQESFVERIEYIADAGETQPYKIRRGDSLYSVAKKFKTTVSLLRDINDFKPGKKVRVGMRIQVPDRSSKYKVKPVMLAKIEKKSNPIEDQEQASTSGEIVTKNAIYYMVQAGDTLSSIADEYDSSVKELRKLNKISRGSYLKIGMKLKVPKDEGIPNEPVVSSDILADNETESLESVPTTGPESAGTTVAATTPAPAGTIVETTTETTAASPLATATPATAPPPSKAPSSIATAEPAAITAKTASTTGATAGAAAAVVTTETGSAEKVKTENQKEVPAESAFHVVKKGENLFRIARKYGIRLGELRKVNNLEPSHSFVKTGYRLLIPLGNASENLNSKPSSDEEVKTKVKTNINKSSKVNFYKNNEKIEKNRKKLHVVRHGEKLNEIAKLYRVSVKDLMKENKLKPKNSKLNLGARLFIPEAKAQKK